MFSMSDASNDEIFIFAFLKKKISEVRLSEWNY